MPYYRYTSRSGRLRRFKGTIVRALTRRNIIAIAVGVLLTGTVLVAFDSWLGGFIDRQAQAELTIGAQRAVALAEARIGQARAALDAVAARGVAACGPAAVAVMRQAAFDAAPVKDIALLGPQGQTLCSANDLPLEAHQVSSVALPDKAGLALDIVRRANGETMVRVRRKAGAGSNQVAALVPASLLLPQATLANGSAGPYVKLMAGDGSLIEAAGAPPAGNDPHFNVSAKSDRYPLAYDVVVPRAIIPAEHADIKWLGKIATGVLVMMLVAFALLMRRRTPDNNPVAEIKRALAAGEFVPYYQPIVDICTGQLRGAEVLVRWRKPDGTLVLPGTFIPLAESSGLIRDMTRDLMRRVCAEAGEAIGRRPALKISFNFAGQLFSDQSIVREVRDVFAGGPIRFSQVVLEVTERDPIENFTETRQTIAALQGLGVRIAIDDVGTGHSGLSYMLKLGVDIIKIDKMFVDAVGTDQNATTIVETLIDLAHNMRMDVVAEGVENFEQVVHLRERGIRQAQGYVFAPPLPGSSFLQLIEAIDPQPKQAGETEAAAQTASLLGPSGREHAEVAA